MILVLNILLVKAIQNVNWFRLLRNPLTEIFCFCQFLWTT